MLPSNAAKYDRLAKVLINQSPMKPTDHEFIGPHAPDADVTDVTLICRVCHQCNKVSNDYYP